MGWARDVVGPDGDAIVTFADTAELVPAGVTDGADGIWDWDGLHLGPAGSRLLGRHLGALIASLLTSPAQVEPALGSASSAALPNRGGDGDSPKPIGIRHILRPLEVWRALPSEEPEGFLGDIGDDYARGALSQEVPTKSLAILFLPLEAFPCVGKEVELRLNDVQRAAVEYAVSSDAGLVACFPKIEDAVGIPWGGTAAEIQRSACTESEGEACVRLSAVASVRLVARHPVRETQGFKVALLQEVLEWSLLERNTSVDDISREVESLESVFAECGELQRRCGYKAAGDFSSRLLSERTADMLAALRDVRLLGTTHVEMGTQARIRFAAAVAHAAVASLSPQARMRFLCEPTSLLPRLRSVAEFLGKVRNVLRARLAFKDLE